MRNRINKWKKDRRRARGWRVEQGENGKDELGRKKGVGGSLLNHC